MTDKVAVQQVLEGMPEVKVSEVHEDSQGYVGVKWTIKLCAPGSRDPDFITLEGFAANKEGMLRQVNELRELLKLSGYVEVGERAHSGSSPQASKPTGGQVSAGADEIEVVRATMSSKGAGRYMLELFAPNHQYADLRYVADAGDMNAMLGGVNEDLQSVPVGADTTVSWVAKWKPGRLNSKGNPYKDLVSLRA